MSRKNDIAYRVQALSQKTPLTALERSRKLKSLQVTKGKLVQQNISCREIINNASADLEVAKRQQESIEAEIAELEKVKSPIVTEHALLRYVERVLGVDLDQCHKDILQLDDSQKVVSGNTIITVFTDQEDHFNLAERERV